MSKAGTITKNEDGTYSAEGVKGYLESNLGITDLTDEAAADYGYKSAEAMI
jgi:hypothetical protein